MLEKLCFHCNGQFETVAALTEHQKQCHATAMYHVGNMPPPIRSKEAEADISKFVSEFRGNALEFDVIWRQQHQLQKAEAGKFSGMSILYAFLSQFFAEETFSVAHWMKAILRFVVACPATDHVQMIVVQACDELLLEWTDERIAGLVSSGPPAQKVKEAVELVKIAMQSNEFI